MKNPGLKYCGSVATIQTPFAFCLSFSFIVQAFAPLPLLLLTYCYYLSFSLSSVYTMHLHYTVELDTAVCLVRKNDNLSFCLLH